MILSSNLECSTNHRRVHPNPCDTLPSVHGSSPDLMFVPRGLRKSHRRKHHTLRDMLVPDRGSTPAPMLRLQLAKQAEVNSGSRSAESQAKFPAPAAPSHPHVSRGSGVLPDRCLAQSRAKFPAPAGPSHPLPPFQPLVDSQPFVDSATFPQHSRHRGPEK